MSHRSHSDSPESAVVRSQPAETADGKAAAPGIAEALIEATALHRNGQLQRAERLYRQILEFNPDQPDALHLLGLAAHQAGQHETAADLILRAIGVSPNVAAFHSNLGLSLQALGNFDAALACYHRALTLNPRNVEALYNMASVLSALGKADDVAACYRRALELKPDFADLHYNLGNVIVSMEHGNLDEAAACYRRALELKPEFADAHNNLGSLLTRQGSLDGAVACYRRALELRPDYTEAYCNLGNVLREQCKLDEAVVCYRRVLELRPDHADIYNSLGTALHEQNKSGEAVACFQKALELKPDHADAHNNLGTALRDQGKLGESVACYRLALEFKPDFAEAYCSLGAALHEQGELGEADACYRRAIECKPEYAEAHCYQSLLRLLQGNCKDGWPAYEWRWRTKKREFASRGFQQPRWDGSPFKGQTILLHAEQGFGDTIQFIRFAHQVKARCGTVIVECQPELIRLLRSCVGVDAILGRGQELPNFDAQVPLLSLPGIFDTTIETISAKIPYLCADRALVKHWQTKLPNNGHFKIGIIWQSNPVNVRLRSRWFPMAQFRSFSQLPGVSLYSLQKGPAGAELKSCGDELPVTDLSEQITDFADTAAIMSQLDLIITCDSAPAHLAGALGRPVWVALPFAADWRWLLEREDSPWYPTMRLFRQQRAGDWDEVFHRIAQALEVLIGGAR